MNGRRRRRHRGMAEGGESIVSACPAPLSRSRRPAPSAVLVLWGWRSPERSVSEQTLPWRCWWDALPCLVLACRSCPRSGCSL